MKKILIVDDEEDMRLVLRAELENVGFECLTDSDGLKAVKSAKDKKPDLIILDLMLPKLSGEEACKIIKKDKKTSHIPIIMLTAKNDDVDKVIGRVIGADIYIVKPYDLNSLLHNIYGLLGIKDEKKIAKGN